MNVVVLSGSLAVEPELREFQSGKRRLDYLLVVRTEQGTHRRTDTLNVKYWDPPAALMRTKLKRGDRLLVAGSIQRRFWSSDAGKKSQHEIIASQVVARPSDLNLADYAFGPDRNEGQSGDLEAAAT